MMALVAETPHMGCLNQLKIFNMKKNILFWATITIVIVAIHLLTPNHYR